MNKLWRWLRKIGSDEGDQQFLWLVDSIEGWVSKVLSLAMILVIIVTVYDLITFLITEIFITKPFGLASLTLIELFGLFLNILIALELLENISGYLKRHVVQVELVIVTALIAVARKIIVLDLEKFSALEVIALAIAILFISLSYLIIRITTRRDQ